MMSMAVFRPVLLTLSLLLCTVETTRTPTTQEETGGAANKKSAPVPSEFVEEGGSITLPCNSVREGQRECDGTTWIFRSTDKPRETEELITNGRISSRVPETLSDRLRVTQNCGLEIQNVRPQDAGIFSCRQYNQSGLYLSIAPVYLSVVSLTKRTDEKKVQLRCKVSSSLFDVKTKWLLNGKDVSDLQLTTKNLGDAVTVTVPDSHSLYKDVDLFTCEVTDGENRKRFSLRSNKPVWLWAVVAAGAGVLVTVVVVVTWRRLRVKPADTRRDPTAEPEEGMSYAIISYNRNNQTTEVRHSEEQVTYSSVRNTTVEDPAQIYATVNK